MDTVYTVVQHFTIFNKIFISILLLLSSREKKFNLYFAFIVFSIVPLYIINYLIYIGYTVPLEIVLLNQILVLLFLPATYLLLLSSFNIKAYFSRWHKLSLSVILSWPVLFTIYYVMNKDLEKEIAIKALENFSSYWLVDLTMVITYICIFAYYSHILRFIRKLEKNLIRLNVHSGFKYKISFFYWFILLILAFDIITICLLPFFSRMSMFYLIVPMSSNVVIFYLIYRAFSGPGIEKNADIELIIKKGDISLKDCNKSASKRALSSKNISNITSRLQILMKEEQPYLNPKLRIQDISDQLDIPKHQLSIAINTIFNQSFTDYVNLYRINEAKIALVNESLLSIEGIGMECGFGSKANFFKEFKKITGVTPNQFKNQHRAVEG